MSNSFMQLEFIEQYGFEHPLFKRHEFCNSISAYIIDNRELSCEQEYKINKIYEFVVNNCCTQRREECNYTTPEKRNYNRPVMRPSTRCCVKKQFVKPSQRITSYFMKIPKDVK